MYSDSQGRKKALKISFIVTFGGIITSFIGAYFNIIFFSIFSQFLIGFGSYSLITLCYTLLADFCKE